jgi:hypothetical protein
MNQFKKSNNELELVFSLPNELLAEILEQISLNDLLQLRRTCQTFKNITKKTIVKKASLLLHAIPKSPSIPKPMESLRARQIVAQYATYNKNYKYFNCTNRSNHFEKIIYGVLILLEGFVNNVSAIPSAFWTIELKQTIYNILTNPQNFTIRDHELYEHEKLLFDDIFHLLLFLADERLRVRFDHERRSLYITIVKLVEYFYKCWGKCRNSIISTTFATRCLRVC